MSFCRISSHYHLNTNNFLSLSVFPLYKRETRVLREGWTPHLYLEINNLKQTVCSGHWGKHMQRSCPFIKVNFTPDSLSDEHLGDGGMEKKTFWSRSNKLVSQSGKQNLSISHNKVFNGVSFTEKCLQLPLPLRGACWNVALQRERKSKLFTSPLGDINSVSVQNHTRKQARGKYWIMWSSASKSGSASPDVARQTNAMHG